MAYGNTFLKTPQGMFCSLRVKPRCDGECSGACGEHRGPGRERGAHHSARPSAGPHPRAARDSKPDNTPRCTSKKSTATRVPTGYSTVLWTSWAIYGSLAWLRGRGKHASAALASRARSPCRCGSSQDGRPFRWSWPHRPLQGLFRWGWPHRPLQRSKVTCTSRLPRFVWLIPSRRSSRP